MTYIGIDPGKGGALATINGYGVHIYPFDKEVYRNVLSDYQRVGSNTLGMCCLEHVNAMPGQGTVSMFHFERTLGSFKVFLQLSISHTS